jgi:hypothetical protein
MEPSDDFKWPDDPEEAWWVTQGTAYGLKMEHVKFAAARFALGGDGSRKNSLAAQLAGLDNLTPSQSFRIARGVGVAKLLAEATRIRAGKQPRVSEADIDRRIDDMIKSPDHRAAGVGIELRAKRDERSARLRDDGATDAAGIVRQILADMGSEGVLSASEMWFYASGGNLLTCPGFELIAPVICRRFPDCWQRYRAPLLTRFEYFKNDYEQAFLDRFDAAGAAPEPTEPEFRAVGRDSKAAKGVDSTDTLPRGNGASPPSDQVEQVEDHAAA